MTESLAPPPAPQAPAPAAAVPAGQMLRAERERQGLSLDQLAGQLKVQPRKLALLEEDRIEALQDRTFARALAQSVCRSLKMDPRPVLAALPQAERPAIEPLSQGLNQPFRDARLGPGPLEALRPSPTLAAGGLLLLGALAVAFWPARLPQSPDDAGVPVSAIPVAPAAEATDTPPAALTAPGTGVTPPPTVTLPSAPVPVLPAAALAPAGAGALAASTAPTPVAPPPPVPAALSEVAVAAAPANAPLQLQTTADSWVEVRDGQGRVLFSRTLRPEEPLRLDGPAPFVVIVGNAAVTSVSYRGAPVDLQPLTRGNVARLELP